MSIASVKYTYQGVEYDLILNAQTGKYEAAVPAGATSSWFQNGHKFGGAVVVTDNAGNQATADENDFESLKLRVLERDAPTIHLVYPAADARVNTARPMFEFVVSDAESGVDLATIKLTVDSVDVPSSELDVVTPVSGSYTVRYTPAENLAEGEHNVKIAASDNDGNDAETPTTIFHVDTVPPSLNVETPVDNLATNAESITVVGSTNDDTSMPVTLTVNGESVPIAHDGSFSKVVPLEEGENTITVIARDASGLTSTIIRHVTKNTVPPTIDAVSIGPNPVDAGKTFVISVTVYDA